MARLDRYIASTVFLSMLLVLLVLGGIDFLFSLIDELGNTEGNYKALGALHFVLLISPRHLYELLPMTALIGALVGLGVLAGGNELISIQAAGWSRGRITWAVMQPTLLVMVVGLAVGEFWAPPMELQAEVYRSLSLGESVGLTRYGHWQRDGNSYVHFASLDSNGTLHGVSLFVFDEQQHLLQELHAERAEYVVPHANDNIAQAVGPDLNAALSETKQHSTWRMVNAKLLEFAYESDSVNNSQSEVPERLWELNLSPESLKVLVVEPERMSINDLWYFANRFTEQGLDAEPYRLGFWKKALQPFNTLVLVLIAISFIFGPLRSASMGLRVFIAISFGLVVTIVQRLLQNLSLVYDLSPLYAVLLPIVLCFLVGVVLLKRRV